MESQESEATNMSPYESAEDSDQKINVDQNLVLNNEKVVESIFDEKASACLSKSVKHLEVKKRTKKDVIWKDVLRRFRKYFQELFIEGGFAKSIDHWDENKLVLRFE